MKKFFGIIVILLLSSLPIVALTNNKKTVQLEVDMARTVIDSIPVKVFDLKLDSAKYNIQTVGKVKSSDEVFVVSQTPGEIKKVFVKIGQKVQQAHVIVQIDDFYARQEYEMAKKAYEQIQKDFNRYSNLADVDAVTQQQLEQLRLQLEGAQTKMISLEQRLNDYIIKAPISGTINQLFVSKGNATGLGTPICEIIGGTSVKIEAKLNPEDALQMQIGQKAILTSEFGHGESYCAQLTEIGERAGKFGGVAAVFMLSAEESKMPKTGSIVDMVMEIQGESRLLVPRQALTNKGGENGLFILKSNNSVEFKKVKYTDFDDQRIALIDNEFNHSRIITEGNYLLKTGDLVKVIND